MSEYANEPIAGLPGIPPAGERIVWQGSPDRRALARTAFHTRLIAGYFGVLTAFALLGALLRGVHGAGDLTGVAMTAILGILGVGLLQALAWGSARTTIYTLTNRRVVLRIGMAVPKCVNLPLGLIASVDLAEHANGTGDLPLTIPGQQKLGYLALWPHARPWRITTPQPMLRAVPDAVNVASLIARTCLAANPQGQLVTPEARAVVIPPFAEAQAA